MSVAANIAAVLRFYVGRFAPFLSARLSLYGSGVAGDRWAGDIPDNQVPNSTMACVLDTH